MASSIQLLQIRSVQLASPFGICVGVLKPGAAGGITGMIRASEFVPKRGDRFANLHFHFYSLLGKSVLFLD